MATGSSWDALNPKTDRIGISKLFLIDLEAEMPTRAKLGSFKKWR